MSHVYFLSDLHYGHNGITDKFRQDFSSSNEHDRLIHDNIMRVANKRNHLYLLGDVALDTDSFHFIDSYIQAFDSVHIVLGNHDHPDLAKFVIEHGGHVYGLKKYKDAWLSHCPIHQSEQYRTTLNIHGHTHKNNVTEIIDGIELPNLYYFNVSCENVGYSPISFQQIKARIKSEQ